MFTIIIDEGLMYAIDVVNGIIINIGINIKKLSIMKTLLKLSLLLFVSLVLFSCQKENEEIDIMCDASNLELLQTKSVKSHFYGNSFLAQLNAIPVHIFYEQGAIAATKKILWLFL